MFNTEFTDCAIASGYGIPVDNYSDGPYTLAELAEEEPGIDQAITTFNEQDDNDTIAAIWIPQWNTWEVWYIPGQRHADYPHSPGALVGCNACESQCFCSTDPGVMPCLYCSITTEDA